MIQVELSSDVGKVCDFCWSIPYTTVEVDVRIWAHLSNSSSSTVEKGRNQIEPSYTVEKGRIWVEPSSTVDKGRIPVEPTSTFTLDKSRIQVNPTSTLQYRRV